MSRLPLALITGANRGLGLELSEQLLERQYRVVATCRDPDAALVLRQMEERFGQRIQVAVLDVESDQDLACLKDWVTQRHQALDLLINNAGVASWGGLHDFRPDRVLELMRVNAISPVMVTREFIPLLRASGNARVVMMSSRLASLGLQRGEARASFAYPMSKAALNMAVVQLATILRPHEICVTAQSPGWVRTEMGGQDAPLSVEESAQACINVFERLTLADTGKFLGEDGVEIPW